MMTLRDRLLEDLKTAMRERNQVRIATLRMVRAEVQNREIDAGKPLEDADIITVISKQVRQHHESIEAFTAGNRPNLVEQEKAELMVLMGYLPEQLSEAETVTLASKVIQEIGATGLTDLGRVMSALMPQVKGKADGNVVRNIVSNLLSS
tara:strand:+ start:89 stop:538 length:450 start_codon:yes stop_codon:yes gene_type:complete